MVYVPPPQYAFVEEVPVESHVSAPVEEEPHVTTPAYNPALYPHGTSSSSSDSSNDQPLPTWANVLLLVVLGAFVVGFIWFLIWIIFSA